MLLNFHVNGVAVILRKWRLSCKKLWMVHRNSRRCCLLQPIVADIPWSVCFMCVCMFDKGTMYWGSRKYREYPAFGRYAQLYLVGGSSDAAFRCLYCSSLFDGCRSRAAKVLQLRVIVHHFSPLVIFFLGGGAWPLPRRHLHIFSTTTF